MLNLGLWADLYLINGISPVDWMQLTDEEQVACAKVVNDKIKEIAHERKREKELEERANFYKNGGM